MSQFCFLSILLAGFLHVDINGLWLACRNTVSVKKKKNLNQHIFIFSFFLRNMLLLGIFILCFFKWSQVEFYRHLRWNDVLQDQKSAVDNTTQSTPHPPPHLKLKPIYIYRMRMLYKYVISMKGNFIMLPFTEERTCIYCKHQASSIIVPNKTFFQFTNSAKTCCI